MRRALGSLTFATFVALALSGCRSAAPQGPQQDPLLISKRPVEGKIRPVAHAEVVRNDLVPPASRPARRDNTQPSLAIAQLTHP